MQLTLNFGLDFVKMLDKTVAGAAFILLQLLDENLQKEEVRWMTCLFQKFNGAELLLDSKLEKLTVQGQNFALLCA